MDIFWKTSAGILLATILWITLQKQEQGISTLLTIAVCCMVVASSFHYWESTFDFLQKIQAALKFQDNTLGILLQAAGISLVTEIIAMICTDAGNSAIGKVMQMLGTSAILYLSIPLFQLLLDIIQEILGVL